MPASEMSAIAQLHPAAQVAFIVMGGLVVLGILYSVYRVITD